MGKWDELGDAVRGVIRAFHGSPNDFDRFDAAKIGTGDGGAAYGYGFNFANDPWLALDYAKRSDGSPGVVYDVEIRHPHAALLDLDAPLEGRHRSAFLDAALSAPDNQWSRMAISDAGRGRAPAKVGIESLMRAYNAEAPNPYESRMLSQRAVSEALFQRGIPGARYVDDGLFSEGGGTRGYVIFPGAEDAIRILSKTKDLYP